MKIYNLLVVKNRNSVLNIFLIRKRNLCGINF